MTGPPLTGPRHVTLEQLRWWHIGEVGRIEREVFGADAWSDELLWSELAQGPARRYLIAVRPSAAEIVGYAGVAVYERESYVQTVAVTAAARGAGIGTRMLVALLRHARARGARTCGLEVRTDNEGARSLYRRLGFVDAGLRRGYYQPSGSDAYVMTATCLADDAYPDLLDRVEGAVLL